MKRISPKTVATLSPERESLARAIAERNAAVEGIARIDAAIDASSADSFSARQRHSVAVAAVDRIAEDAADHAIAPKTGGRKARAPLTLRAARAAVADAADAVEMADATLATLKVKRDSAAGRMPLLHHVVEQAAATVIRSSPEVAALVDEVEDLQRRLYQRGVALTYLYNRQGLDSGRVKDAGGNIVFARAESVCFRLQMSAITYHDLKGRDTSLDDAWRQAMAALQVDASAPLPAGFSA